MKDFREEQKEYKTKIEDKIATSSNYEMVGIVMVSDLDLNIKMPQLRTYISLRFF